ncbi:NAD-dependent epimerase/dehydratase family protein [Cyanobium sp. N5-Cardenillas]|uniref:NAD-dependent epimerase/dehydratase family protein n=1 Tax=Cyanobium sp. N5-Cardenillas TaxID=2823720 RepID=UPI0020CB904D|nr:NAD-dependent epimerase/dehydratase family protein [Cyanobium sp. N5-Cardenillas]MCP9785129.1 NAD-dependent epimerase/dehydratase family protein [Cyanobium sp. N5-Cardenillas]
MRILVMGGTRFVGRPLVNRLLGAGHELTLFTRGRQPVPEGIEHLQGDRSSAEGLAALQDRPFDVIVDSSGRTLEDTRQVIARTGPPSHRLVYVSSAGVYADSELWPLDEESPTDPESRHAGKLDTEAWLRQEGIPFTSFRPTYIVGPGNYNPVESWFFDRLVHGRPVPLPGDGSTITQLGHVADLAAAMARCIEVEAAANRIYNCTGSQGISFRGLVAAAARACGADPEAVDIRSFDPAGLDKKARKAFPLRLAHFLTDTHRVRRELAWEPAFDLEATLADSYTNDYALRMPTTPDFSGDEALLG